MSAITLGYQCDITISKIEIAKTQLSEAIWLFLDEKFLCATTLAGAAESVFSGLLNQRGESSIVEDSTAAIRKFRESRSLETACESKPSTYYNQWNSGRNIFKHHDKTDNEMVTINLFDESYWMIRRALANARKLGVVIDNGTEFENWVISNLNL